jgi:cyclophilin family peptidyl-prolyl cis-trans isomerase
MTKFDPVGKGERGGRSRDAPSAMARKRAMEMYKLTGKHPLLDARDTSVERTGDESTSRARKMRKVTTSTNASRVKVFFDVSVTRDEASSASSSSIIVELFDDEAPAACSRFARACESGDVGAVFRDDVDVHDDLRVVLRVKAAPGGGAMAEEGALTHAAAGVVGVDRSSGDVSVLTEACESLDASHQVIGRLVSGLDVLRALTHRGKGETRAIHVKIAAMGVVRGGADVSTLIGISAKARAEAAQKAREEAEKLKLETAQETMDRLSRESAKKGAELAKLVRSKAAPAPKSAAKPAAKKGMLDSVLGAGGSEDEDDSDSDSDSK